MKIQKPLPIPEDRQLRAFQKKGSHIEEMAHEESPINNDLWYISVDASNILFTAAWSEESHLLKEV